MHYLVSYDILVTKRRTKLAKTLLRKKLISIPARLVNHSGRMIMHLMAGFPFTAF